MGSEADMLWPFPGEGRGPVEEQSVTAAPLRHHGLPDWTSIGLNIPRMFKDRPGDDPTRYSFAGEAFPFDIRGTPLI